MTTRCATCGTPTTPPTAQLAGGITASIAPAVWKRGRKWETREDDLLRAAVPQISLERLAFILERTSKAVLHRVHSLGLRYNTHPARFWASVHKQADCWEWMGGKRNGYGFYSLNHKLWQAHRLAFETQYGPLPAGYQVHHICHNKGCVNPAHLMAIHITKHVLLHDSAAGKHARQTHCHNGHMFTAENTYSWGGQRHCRTCRRERYQDRKRQRTAEAQVLA